MRLSTLGAALFAATILAACVVQPLPAPRYAPPPAPVQVYEQPAYAPAEDEPVVSVYVDPPLYQPEPIAVGWAPPPMLVEVPPPQPYGEAIWTGGYWAWEGRWFWSAGRWAPPPRPRYQWVQPYYEHRADVVVFVPGFWCAPEARFVPPPAGLSISVAIAGPGIRRGRPPMGPQGVFIPPPPGSRAGIIVPAPIGTPPAVVVSAPAVVNVGMRVRGNNEVNSHNNTVNDNRVTNNVTNVTNVTIEAPAGSTANGQAFQNSVSARANVAASMGPAGRAAAPQPTSTQAIPSYVAGRQPAALPSAQPTHGDRGDRGGMRPAMPPSGTQQPGIQQPAQQQQPPQPGQQGQQRPVGGRPEFDQPPRQPAPVDGAQRGGPVGQPQGQRPAAQGQPPQQQPQAQPQPPQPQGNPQDPRRHGRGGNPQGQPGAQQAGQPVGQPGAQPAAPAVAQPGAQPPAKVKETKEPKSVPERKAERERKEDRDKKDGERDR
jgi:hypothetical protein